MKRKAEEEVSSDEDSEDRRRRKRKEKKEQRRQAEERAKQQKAEEENNLPDPSVLVQVFNPFRFMHWDIPTVEQYKEETKALEPQQNKPANSFRTFVSTSQKKPTLKSKADSNRTTSGLRQGTVMSTSKKEPGTPGKSSVKNDSKYNSKRTLGNGTPDDLREPSKNLSSKQEPNPKIKSVRAMPDEYHGDVLDEEIKSSAKQIPRKQTALKMGSPIG